MKTEAKQKLEEITANNEEQVDSLKEIKRKYSRQIKTYPPTEWWDWDSD